MWTVLFALPLLCVGSDEATWRARLALPRLFQADLDLEIAAAELGASGYDPGFPAEPNARLAAVEAALAGETPSAHDLHQAASALAALRRTEPLQRALPAALRAYQRELEAAPDDVVLRLNAADAFALAGGVSRDDRFFRDALALLDAAGALAPEDARIPDLASDIGARRAVARGAGPAALADLDVAETRARAALALAPEALRSHWRLFHVRHLRSVLGPGDARTFVGLATLADELAGGARAIEGGERLELAAEGYWFLANLPPRMARLRSTSDLELPAPDAVVAQRLAAFRARMDELSAGPMRAKLSHAWWMLSVFAAPAGEWATDLERATAGGVAALPALALALVAFHGRGEAQAAGEVARQLVERTAQAPHEGVDRALAVYLHGIGDDEGALARVLACPRPDAALRLARAVLELRLGRSGDMAARLELLAAEVARSPLAGEISHALGVAYALEQRHEQALDALERAAEGAPADAPVRATYAEVRAARGG